MMFHYGYQGDSEGRSDWAETGKNLVAVVEEIVISAVVPTSEPPEEIMRASAPVLSFGHAEPALLLQEVEEYDLPQ